MGWAFFFAYRDWHNPLFLLLTTLSTTITFVIAGCHELPFTERPGTPWGLKLREWLLKYYAPLLAICRTTLCYLMLLIIHELARRDIAPGSLWFYWSYVAGIPLICLRQLATRLWGGSPHRPVQIAVETARLIGHFAALSLLMSYINPKWFPLVEGQATLTPPFLAVWTPVVLTGLTALVMYFDAILGISERRKRG